MRHQILFLSILLSLLIAGSASAQGEPAAPAPAQSGQSGSPLLQPGSEAQTQGGQPAPGGNPAAPANPMGGSFFTLLLVGLAVFLLLQTFLGQRNRKKQAQVLESLKVGSQVVVLNGIHGVITKDKGASVVVKIADGIELEMDRSALAVRGEAKK